MSDILFASFFFFPFFRLNSSHAPSFLLLLPLKMNPKHIRSTTTKLRFIGPQRPRQKHIVAVLGSSEIADSSQSRRAVGGTGSGSRGGLGSRSGLSPRVRVHTLILEACTFFFPLTTLRRFDHLFSSMPVIIISFPPTQVLRADKHRLALLEEEVSLMAALELAGAEEEETKEGNGNAASVAPSLKSLSLNDDDDNDDNDDKRHKGKKKPAKKKGGKGSEESSSSASSPPSQVHDDTWWSTTMARLAEVGGGQFLNTFLNLLSHWCSTCI
jgi:hypothetical protein